MGFLPFAPEHLPCSVGALAYRAAVLQPCQVCIATKACSVGNALLACSLAVQLLPSGLQFLSWNPVWQLAWAACWKCQFGGGSLVAGGKNPCQGIETWQVGRLAGCSCLQPCPAHWQPCWKLWNVVGALADRTGLCWNFCLNSLVCSSVLVQLVADWIGNFATSRSVVWQPCLGSLAALS